MFKKNLLEDDVVNSFNNWNSTVLNSLTNEDIDSCILEFNNIIDGGASPLFKRRVRTNTSPVK